MLIKCRNFEEYTSSKCSSFVNIGANRMLMKYANGKAIVSLFNVVGHTEIICTLQQIPFIKNIEYWPYEYTLITKYWNENTMANLLNPPIQIQSILLPTNDYQKNLIFHHNVNGDIIKMRRNYYYLCNDKKIENILLEQRVVNIMQLCSATIDLNAKHEIGEFLNNTLRQKLIQTAGLPAHYLHNIHGEEVWIYTGIQNDASCILFVFLNSKGESSGYYCITITDHNHILSTLVDWPGTRIHANNNIYTVEQLLNMEITKGTYIIENYRFFDHRVV